MVDLYERPLETASYLTGWEVPNNGCGDYDNHWLMKAVSFIGNDRINALACALNVLADKLNLNVLV